MWTRLEDELLNACNRRILAAERRRGRLADENRRRARRSVRPTHEIPIDAPPLWSQPGFNPYQVRSNRSSIAHAIRTKLQARTYEPFEPHRMEIAKPGGGTRVVSVFPIADEVISLRLFKALLNKNRSRLSSRSFAYRSDIGAQDAIRHLRREWRDQARLFVAEYDLTDFFDRISHQHIRSSIDALDFSMTDLERYLIEAFLSSPLPPILPGAAPVRRSVGVPQGTSISLFLANVATGLLDRKLETMNLDFARYADDLLVWSDDYAAISKGATEIWKWAEAAGVSINPKKSAGIRIVVPPDVPHAELASTHSVRFLSHNIGLDSVAVGERSIDAIKRRVGRLLYDNLLREPRRGTQDLGRLTDNDRDYATFIWQLRRYLYGSHSETEVRRLETGSIPRVFFTGVVAHFPYTTDDSVLEELDEWIVTQTWLALARREALLRPGVSIIPTPWGLSRDELRRCRSTSGRTGRTVDLRLPSTLRMVRVIRRAVSVHGVASVDRTLDLY
jgi:RNA-directed DNA polymerase